MEHVTDNKQITYIKHTHSKSTGSATTKRFRVRRSEGIVICSVVSLETIMYHMQSILGVDLRKSSIYHNMALHTVGRLST